MSTLHWKCACVSLLPAAWWTAGSESSARNESSIFVVVLLAKHIAGVACTVENRCFQMAKALLFGLALCAGVLLTHAARPTPQLESWLGLEQGAASKEAEGVPDPTGRAACLRRTGSRSFACTHRLLHTPARPAGCATALTASTHRRRALGAVDCGKRWVGELQTSIRRRARERRRRRRRPVPAPPPPPLVARRFPTTRTQFLLAHFSSISPKPSSSTHSILFHASPQSNSRPPARQQCRPSHPALCPLRRRTRC
jgi:hypothetical protein